MRIIRPAADTETVNSKANVLVAPVECAASKKIAHGAISSRRATAYFRNIKLVYRRASSGKNVWRCPPVLGIEAAVIGASRGDLLFAQQVELDRHAEWLNAFGAAGDEGGLFARLYF